VDEDLKSTVNKYQKTLVRKIVSKLTFSEMEHILKEESDSNETQIERTERFYIKNKVNKIRKKSTLSILWGKLFD